MRGSGGGGGVESFELGEEAVGLAVLAAGAVFLGALVVLVHVLKFLLAFLGASPVSQLGQFPASHAKIDFFSPTPTPIRPTPTD